MHLAFVDFVYGYDAARPDTDEPLGGTTSAICFLAREMVAAGTACTFFNRVAQPLEAHGIKTFPLQDLGTAIEQGGFDAYIFCGRWTAEFVQLVRVNTKAPLIGWMHESLFASPMTPAIPTLDGIVFVSEWQKKINQHAAQPHWKQAVIRNAMNPRAAAAFPQGTAILSAKKNPPVFIFAGQFARGAFHIPPLLEKIRAKRTDFAVEMYCNLDPSRDPAKDEPYIQWLRDLPNIAHVGMVGQPELCRRMREASILLTPNPWPETSCITLIDGLASGLEAVTTSRAALPETAAGFAREIPIDSADDPVRFDMPVDYDAFASAVVATLAEREQNPDATEARLRRQIDHFRAHYQWSQRVQPWLDFIADLKN